MRAFIFSVWIAAEKSAAATVTALESLSAQHYTVAQQGGKQMLSATVQGKSFTYEIPPGIDSTHFAGLAYEAWKQIRKGGASAGVMTDEELESFLEDSANEVTSVTRARFQPAPLRAYGR